MCDVFQRRLLELSTLPSDLGRGTECTLNKSAVGSSRQRQCPAVCGLAGLQCRLREGVIPLLRPPEAPTRVLFLL